MPSGNFEAALKIQRTNSTPHPHPNASTASRFPGASPSSPRHPGVVLPGLRKVERSSYLGLLGEALMGPAGRGAPAAGCCSPHLPRSPVLQRGEPVPSGAGRRSGARGRQERGSRAPGGGRSAAPRGAPGSGTVGAGTGTAVCTPEGRGGGTRVGGRRTPLRALRLPLAPRPQSPQRVPTVYICIAPSLPLRSSPRRPDSTSVVSARSSVPSPSRPPSSPSSPHPPSPGAACCLDSPGVASLRHLALQCNSGTHNQPGPLKPTAPLKSDHQV